MLMKFHDLSLSAVPKKIMSWSPAQLTAWPRGYPQLRSAWLSASHLDCYMGSVDAFLQYLQRVLRIDPGMDLMIWRPGLPTAGYEDPHSLATCATLDGLHWKLFGCGFTNGVVTQPNILVDCLTKGLHNMQLANKKWVGNNSGWWFQPPWNM